MAIIPLARSVLQYIWEEISFFANLAESGMAGPNLHPLFKTSTQRQQRGKEMESLSSWDSRRCSLHPNPNAHLERLSASHFPRLIHWLFLFFTCQSVFFGHSSLSLPVVVHLGSLLFPFRERDVSRLWQFCSGLCYCPYASPSSFWLCKYALLLLRSR